MLTVFAVILTILYTASWLGYSKYQFLERDSSDQQVKLGANKKWHSYKFLNQVVFFAAIYLTVGLEFALALTLTYQLAFNSGINVIVEGQPVFHLGNDPIDRVLKSIFGERLAYIILALVVAASLAACYFWPHLLDSLNYNVCK